MTARDKTVEFRLLGPFQASERGQPLKVGTGKQRALLALLLLSAGEVVSTDRLIDALWGEHPPASALNSVHVYVSQLRKALSNGRLETRGQGYLLALEPEELDLGRFERLLGEGRVLLAEGEPKRGAKTLRAALALWRGPPLSDFASEPFAQGEIARLEELHLAALEERIEADLALGRHSELVSELEALIREHPLRERLRAQLMLALYRSGRQAEALAAYQQARKMLAEELGLEPGRRPAFSAGGTSLGVPPRSSPVSGAVHRMGVFSAIGGWTHRSRGRRKSTPSTRPPRCRCGRGSSATSSTSPPGCPCSRHPAHPSLPSEWATTRTTPSWGSCLISSGCDNGSRLVVYATPNQALGVETSLSGYMLPARPKESNRRGAVAQTSRSGTT